MATIKTATRTRASASLKPTRHAHPRVANIESLIRYYPDKSQADMQEAVEDLLTNLRLFCEVHGVDYYKAEKKSYQDYLHERNAVRDKTAA